MGSRVLDLSQNALIQRLFDARDDGFPYACLYCGCGLDKWKRGNHDRTLNHPVEAFTYTLEEVASALFSGEFDDLPAFELAAMFPLTPDAESQLKGMRGA